MTSGAIHVAQVPESGWPCPLPPPLGCNLSTNRKRKPKWRRCVAASIAVGPSAIRTGSRTRPSDWGFECTVRPCGRPKKQSYSCHVYLYSLCSAALCVLQIWWLSPFTLADFSPRLLTVFADYPLGPSHSLRGRGNRQLDHAVACPWQWAGWFSHGQIWLHLYARGS